MNTTPAQRVFAWLCLLIYLSASAVGGHGFVLCFDHGHIALEFASGADCLGCASDAADDPTLGDAAAQPIGEQITSAPACPCNDAALPTAGIAHKRAVQFVIEVPAPLISTLHAAWNVEPARRAMWNVRERDSIASIAGRARSRGIVLLI